MLQSEPDVIRALPDPTDRNASAADRLFDAVLCLLVEQGTQLLATAVRPDDVADRAGKGRASYYRTAGFPSVAGEGVDPRRAILIETIDRVLRNAAGDLDQMFEGVAAFLDGSARESVPVEVIRSLAVTNFSELVHDPYFYIQTLAVSQSPNSHELQAALGAYYATVAAGYDELFRTVLDHWGYRPRPPFSYHDLSVLLTAIAEGLAMRNAGEPSIDGAYYADMLTMVLPGVLVTKGSSMDTPRVDLDQVVATATAPPTRSTITAAALRLFGAQRVAAPTIDEVAREAGCSVETVVSAFGGLAGVVASVWDEWSPEFVETVASDRSVLRRSDPMTLLYRLAIRIATRGLEHQRLVQALMIAELSAPPSGSTDTVTSLFESLLGEAVESGDFNPPGRDTPGRRVRRFAETIRRSLLLEVTTTSVIEPVDVEARQLVDYVWAVTIPASRHQ